MLGMWYDLEYFKYFDCVVFVGGVSYCCFFFVDVVFFCRLGGSGCVYFGVFDGLFGWFFCVVLGVGFKVWCDDGFDCG